MALGETSLQIPQKVMYEQSVIGCYDSCGNAVSGKDASWEDDVALNTPGIAQTDRKHVPW